MQKFTHLYERLNNLRARLGLFGSAGGISFAIVVLVVGLGTPLSAHADVVGSVVSWVGGLVSKVGDATLGALFEGISYIILSFADFILYIVGLLFNYIVDVTVFSFATHIGQSPGIIAAWSVLRDISNIALLFGFVFIGIATILNIHGYEVKKTLPRLIIFAVLLNFSLLASQAVIDVSNVFATVLYNQGASQDCAGQTAEECTKNVGISGKIIQMGGIATIFSESDTANLDGSETSNTTWGMVYLGLAIFVMVTSVVLLAGVILLVTRAVVLCILMALAPLGFAGMAIPPLEKYAKMWWNKLISQSFFAPVYLLFIYVSLKIMEGVTKSLGGTGTFTDLLAHGTSGSVLGANSSGITIVVVYSLLIGFMIASLMIAKQMGAIGADFATSTAGKAVGGAVLGSTAFVGRRTVGRLSHRVGHDIRSGRYGEWIKNSEVFGRNIAEIADKGGHASFDVRKTKIAETLAKTAKTELGKASGEGGYHKELEEGKKSRDEYAKSLTLSHDEQHQLDELRYESWQIQQRIFEAKANNLPTDELEAAKKRADAQAAGIASRVQQYQDQYATRLDNNIFNRLRNPGVAFNRTAGTQFRKGGATAIRNRLSESPQDRLMKQLNKALEPQQPAAPQQAQAPQPAGGGGGGAPAPAPAAH